MQHYCFINGQSYASEAGEWLDVICPSDGQKIAEIPRGQTVDIHHAVKAAKRAFRNGAWATMPAFERGRLLANLHQLVLDNSESLALLESQDTGKPLRQGKADAAASARYYEFYAGAADKVHGDTIPFLEDYIAYTTREPHGVVAAIIPWNYPLQILARVLGAALAMGNTVVVKPAEDASLSTLKMAELCHQAGFPDGVVNVVTGLGQEAGAALSAHPDVDYVTFTGSPQTGAAIQTAAAQNNRGVTMELGGKSPQILFDDADLDRALPIIVNAIIQNGGQTCSAGSRALVHQSIFDEVAERLGARFSQLTAEPHNADGDLGPMINIKQRNRIAQLVADAEARGLPVIAKGGISPDAPADGCYYPPVLFGPISNDDKIAQIEIFGPVLVLIPFANELEAVGLANDTDYGLVAGVWTKDGARGHRVAKAIRAGQVYINAYGAGGGIELPFGGFGKSGHGREKGFEALMDMSATKTTIIHHG